MTFVENIIEYLERQMQLELDEIELHKKLPDQDKIDQGYKIQDAIITSSSNDNYILSTSNDNTKLRKGDIIAVKQRNKTINATVTDIGLNTLAVQANKELEPALPVDLEVVENTYVKSLIELLRMIGNGTKSGESFINILEGVQTLPSPNRLGITIIPTQSGVTFTQSQTQVINDVLKKPSVYCIQGPPGTGKTAVLAQIARDYAANGIEVLVVANTHQAVNNALNAINPSPTFEVAKIGPSVRNDSLATSVKEYDKLSEMMSRKKRKTTIAGMTLHAAVTAMGIRNSSFTPELVLVDEAGQIPVAYASILGSFGCSSIVFLGDDRQLPPIFLPELIKHNLSKSIFEYLCSKYPSLRKRLDVTYRMNDEITNVVTTLYYDDLVPNGQHAIKSANSAASRHSVVGTCKTTDPIVAAIIADQCSITCVNVTPAGANCKDSNEYEAAVVAAIAKTFEANGISSGDYVVTTPYRRQSKLIQASLLNQDPPVVNTVDALQGIGAETVIISLSATDPVYLNSVSRQTLTSQLDFILNPNRMNVSISRAKTKVIIMCCPELHNALFAEAEIPLHSLIDG